jgi:hypothetical protein
MGQRWRSILLCITLLLPISTLSTATDCRAQAHKSLTQSRSGFLYGQDYAFMVSAPPGWVFDDNAGRSQGVIVVFYREGESWQDGKAVMYANVTYKHKGHEDTLADVIRSDIGQMRRNMPNQRAQPASALRTGVGGSATVYTFTPIKSKTQNSQTPWEEVAYIDGPKSVIIFVLTVRTEAAYRKTMPDFNQLVRSYVPMSVHQKARTRAIKSRR